MEGDEFLGAGSHANVDQSEHEIEILGSNWDTVRVYQACSWTIHTGLEQPYYQGIDAREIISAVMLLRISRSQWQKITQGIILHMVPAAKKYLNRDRKARIHE